MQVTPQTIKRLGRDAVEITWQDGHRSVYPNRYLRESCPCASCREGVPSRRRLPVVGNPGDLHPVQIGVVGRYALSIQWSDGHDSGIYSYDTLRQICPCDACQAERTPETTT